MGLAAVIGRPDWPLDGEKTTSTDRCRLFPYPLQSGFSRITACQTSLLEVKNMKPAEQPPDQAQAIRPEQEAAYQSGDVTLEWLFRQPGSFFLPYAGKWIAAKDCQIVASAANHRELMAQLEGVDLRSVIVHRVERPGRVIYR